MKRLLLLLCITLSGLVQAQSISIYESSLSEGLKFNYETGLYERTELTWEKTKFAYTKEKLHIEFKPGNPVAIWWAYYESLAEGIDCYYVEEDMWKVCVNTRDNELWLYREMRDGQFEYMLVLSKIKKINTVTQ